MTTSISQVFGGSVCRSQSAPTESFAEGSCRGRAFKRLRDGQPDDEQEKKIQQFYDQLKSAIDPNRPVSSLRSCGISLPLSKRARTDGVLFGPKPSSKTIPFLELGPSRMPLEGQGPLLGALTDLDLNQ